MGGWKLRSRTVNCGLCTKKMSGRWGHRPLGRGDGGNSNPKSVWFFWPFYCAREQQDDPQEHTGDDSRKPKQLPTTCLVCSSRDSPSMARWVHSFQYFPLPPMALFLVRKYSRPRRVPRSSASFFLGACLKIDFLKTDPSREAPI